MFLMDTNNTIYGDMCRKPIQIKTKTHECFGKTIFGCFFYIFMSASMYVFFVFCFNS